MGEKYYRPIIKDGDHLIQSTKNPNRVRGLTRDENNKNPDIIEWEECELETFDYDSDLIDAEKPSWDIPNEDDFSNTNIFDTIETGLELLNSILVFLNEHPDIVRKAANGFRSAKRKTTKLKAKLIPSGKFRKKKKAAFNKETVYAVVQNEVSSAPRQILIVEDNSLESLEGEEQQSYNKANMSIEDARVHAIQMVLHYVEFKKHFESLSNANITDLKMLGLDETLVILESIIEQYPALMDEKTQQGILSALALNLDDTENNRIKEVLHIGNL